MCVSFLSLSLYYRIDFSRLRILWSPRDVHWFIYHVLIFCGQIHKIAAGTCNAIASTRSPQIIKQLESTKYQTTAIHQNSQPLQSTVRQRTWIHRISQRWNSNTKLLESIKYQTIEIHKTLNPQGSAEYQTTRFHKLLRHWNPQMIIRWDP